MKNFKIITLFISIILVLVGCSSNGGETAQNTTSGENSIENVTISIGHINPETDEAQFHQGILKFIEIVEEKTNGSVKFEVYPGGELGGEREMIESTQLGTLDMVVTSTGPLGNFADKTLALDFPFLFKDREHAYRVLDGEIGDEINQQIAENGMYNLAWWETGFRQITNNSREIKTPADLTGLKIRTMENPVHLFAFEHYGAAPTPMAFTELYTGLEQGVVDGQENPLTVIVPNKLQEVQKYLSISNHVYSPGAVLINKEKFDSFSPELQKILTEAAQEAKVFERQFIADLEDQLISGLKEEGVIVTEQIDYDAFLEATQAVYKEYESEYGELINKILEY